jgi:hypothetical protein
VLRLTASDVADTRSAGGSARAVVVSLACLFRCAPLFFRASPATPLRVLCIISLDIVHVLRHASPLGRERREQLSLLLDFQACTNAVWDDKPLRSSQCHALRERLEAAGLAPWIHAYLERLRQLETERPTIGNGVHRFDAVRDYREAVVRLSLATVAGVALHARHIDEAINATDTDADLAVLFRMAMQCQVIDDVVDYREDRASALPGFMTAAPFPQALAWAACAVRSYGVSCAHGRSLLPLRPPLYVLTALAGLSVRVARWIYDESFWNDQPPSLLS